MKKIITISVVLGLIAALAVAIGGRVTETMETRASEVPFVRPPPAVEVAAPETRDFPTVVAVTGELEPLRVVEVFAERRGRVEAAPLDVGVAVEAGAVLVELDKTELTLRSDQAKAQVRAASAAAAQAGAGAKSAKTELERAKRLRARGAITEAELDRAQAAYDSAAAGAVAARAQVGVARAAAALAEYAVEQSRVTAPVAGVIAARHLDLGDVATPNAPLFTIEDHSSLVLDIQVPAAAATLLAADTPVQFSVSEYPDREYTGAVAHISPSLDATTRRVRVRVSVPAGQKGLMPRMFASARIEIDRREATLAVPLEAVVQDPDGAAVYVVREGKAVRIPASTQLTYGGFVAAPPGVEAGDHVVVRGQKQVVSGAEVVIREPGEGR